MPLFIAVSGAVVAASAGGKDRSRGCGEPYVPRGKDRSDEGEERRRTAAHKKNVWRNTGCWPWWIVHDTEKERYTDFDSYGLGPERDRRIYDSIWWRLDQVENPVVAGWKDWLWTDLYGHDAWWEAMDKTQPLFEKAQAEGLTFAQHTADSPWPGPPAGRARGSARQRSREGKGGGRGRGRAKGRARARGGEELGRGCGKGR